MYPTDHERFRYFTDDDDDDDDTLPDDTPLKIREKTPGVVREKGGPDPTKLRPEADVSTIWVLLMLENKQATNALSPPPPGFCSRNTRLCLFFVGARGEIEFEVESLNQSFSVQGSTPMALQ